MDGWEELIGRVNAGDSGARDQLFTLAYPELRKIARARLHEGGRNTYLDTTALIHETYLRFLRGNELRTEHRRAFLAYSSKVMRSVIVDSVREREAQRRGGDLERLTLDTEVADVVPASGSDVLRVHEALEALGEAEPRMAQVVEMRYFGGYSESEIGDALGLGERQVRRDWVKAQLLLRELLSD
jgi:RNA polymerase sigma factor (TIGR02999 family)